MTVTDTLPRRSRAGILSVWIVAAVAGLAIGLFVPSDLRAAWMAVALGACLLLAFAVQLAGGRSHGFTVRVAASVVGALAVLGIVSLGFGLAAVVPG
ncbi:hypothetical protein [Microbacterium aurantiacum]|uniref:hypothetical protein n=1 Tax=Microbacterium aurantiacum TaxID=162393 RepID=UPI0040358B4E